jgi:hypothetical protein
MPKVGESYRVYYNEGNRNNRVIHVRAIVDDEYVVIRYWSYRQKDWMYRLEWVGYFHANQEHLTLIKKGDNVQEDSSHE